VPASYIYVPASVQTTVQTAGGVPVGAVWCRAPGRKSGRAKKDAHKSFFVRFGFVWAVWFGCCYLRSTEKSVLVHYLLSVGLGLIATKGKRGREEETVEGVEL
jgi:hypothetical protein